VYGAFGVVVNWAVNLAKLALEEGDDVGAELEPGVFQGGCGGD